MYRRRAQASQVAGARSRARVDWLGRRGARRAAPVSTRLLAKSLCHVANGGLAHEQLCRLRGHARREDVLLGRRRGELLRRIKSVTPPHRRQVLVIHRTRYASAAGRERRSLTIDHCSERVRTETARAKLPRRPFQPARRSNTAGRSHWKRQRPPLARSTSHPSLHWCGSSSGTP
jgi:hypothetical protein